MGYLETQKTPSCNPIKNKIVENLFRPQYPNNNTGELYQACYILNIKLLCSLQAGVTIFKIMKLNELPSLLKEIMRLSIAHRYPARAILIYLTL